MRYRYGDPYQLAAEERYWTNIYPPEDINTRWIFLGKNGLMVIKESYAWDGPSGPIKWMAEKLEKIPFAGAWLKAKYLKTILTPSLFHDGGYQLLRLRLLPLIPYRQQFDELIRDMALERGMLKIRANWIYNSVHVGAEYAADPKNKKVVYEVD